VLENAPGVKIMTTSREPLNLNAEWVFDVHGLPVPSNSDVEPIETNSAAALFLQRAKQANVNLTTNSANLSAITRICQLVEGLPLGLELAASWTRAASLPEIAQEIERSIDFLTTHARDVPARHRSIRAVFDHSWNLLKHRPRRGGATAG
jgi:predicted ATPase